MTDSNYIVVRFISFDVGDIVLQESTPIGSRVTAVELTDQLARMGAALLFRCVSDLKHHLDRSISQPMEGVTLGAYQTRIFSFIVTLSTLC